jgi:putative salt-induced outer membrane protein YdiY
MQLRGPDARAFGRRWFALMSGTHLGNILAGFVLVSGAAAAAAAQPPAAKEPPPRLEASAQFTFLGTTGNASTSSLGAGGEAIWRPDPWEHSARAAFAQTEADDVLSARSLAALYKASRKINPRLSGYGRYDFLRDVFAGVELRHIVEGGVSYLAVEEPRQRLRLDAGLGYLYEDNPDEHFDSATLGLAAAYRAIISATSELTYEPRFLVTLADADAWKYDQVAALTAALNSILSLKLSHTIRYSARPPFGFKTTDTITAVSLVARVRRPPK